jgi:hypothetical protein
VSNFGRTLFGGSGFIRWSLTPFVLIFAIFMPLLIEQWTPTRVALMIGIEFMCLALLAGFWLPARFGHWAFRGLAAMVFLVYATYLVHELFIAKKPFTLVERRSEASPRNAVLGLIFIGLPSLWFALRGRFTLRPEASPEQLIAERQAYEQRILRPDWDFYERHLQRPAPPALRELYTDHALVTDGNLACGDEVINTFEPLDEAALIDTRDQLGFDIVPFATTDCGDPIYLRPGPGEADNVYVTHHDGGDTEVLAESVSAMLATLRHANQQAS